MSKLKLPELHKSVRLFSSNKMFVIPEGVDIGIAELRYRPLRGFYFYEFGISHPTSKTFCIPARTLFLCQISRWEYTSELRASHYEYGCACHGRHDRDWFYNHRVAEKQVANLTHDAGLLVDKNIVRPEIAAKGALSRGLSAIRHFSSLYTQ